MLGGPVESHPTPYDWEKGAPATINGGSPNLIGFRAIVCRQSLGKL